MQLREAVAQPWHATITVLRIPLGIGNFTQRSGMMLYGCTAMKASGWRRAQQRLGAALALLALLSQMVLTLLPMPAMAGGSSAPDGMAICRFDASGTPVAPKPGDHSGQHMPNCPVCQAVQLLGGLLPPTPIAALAAPLSASSVDFPLREVSRPRLALTHHQARAPPRSV